MSLYFSRKGSFLLLVLFLVSACAKDSQETYKDEAKNLCALYDVQRLKKIFSDTNVGDFNQLATDTANIVKSKEFKALFEGLASSGYRNYYAALQPKVSQLIGEEWHCDNMQKFYDIRWVNERTPKDPSGDNKLIKISISPTNFIKINEVRIEYNKTKIWKVKLRETIVAEKPWLFTILVPEDSFTEEDATPMLELFRELKIGVGRYYFQQYRLSEFEVLERFK